MTNGEIIKLGFEGGPWGGVISVSGILDEQILSGVTIRLDKNKFLILMPYLVIK